MRLSDWRRGTLGGFAVVLFLGAVGLTVVTGRVHASALRSKCALEEGADPNDHWQPIPKGAKIDCLREIASKQLSATFIQQDYVPSDETGCETSAQHPKTTQISVTAYQNVDKLPYDRYTKHEGYVVARIDNPSNCTTRHLKLLPGHSYYVVIEGKGTKGRLVDIATGTSTTLAKFISCTLDKPPAPPTKPETPLNVAFLRTAAKRCNHNPVPEGQMKALFSNRADSYLADSSRTLSARLLIDDPWIIWISCGTDCCFAEL